MSNQMRICAASLALMLLISSCGGADLSGSVSRKLLYPAAEMARQLEKTDAVEKSAAGRTETAAADTDAAQPDADLKQKPQTEAAPEPPDDPTPELPPLDPEEYKVLWTKVFRTAGLPVGYMSFDSVAFYDSVNKDTAPIVMLSLDELAAAAAAIEPLPRTHYYDALVDPSFDVFFHAMDYAMYKGYTRFVLPSFVIDDKLILSVEPIIQRCFNLNSAFFSTYTAATKDTGDGRTIFYNLVSFTGLELNDCLTKYHAALEKAEEIIAMLPADATDYEKVSYYYNWLTENVRYDSNDYYGGADWNLAYDALILNNTVCAGYAMAFYFLCNMSGVDCINIIGYVDGDRQNGGHMWNKARIDGCYYIFDATWDEGVPPEKYLFFGISDARLAALSRRELSELNANTDPDSMLNLTSAGGAA